MTTTSTKPAPRRSEPPAIKFPASPLRWLQVVAGSTGTYVVRCFEGGACFCTCDGFAWRRTCSHLAVGKLQEAWEALAQAELAGHLVAPAEIAAQRAQPQAAAAAPVAEATLAPCQAPIVLAEEIARKQADKTARGLAAIGDLCGEDAVQAYAGQAA